MKHRVSKLVGTFWRQAFMYGLVVAGVISVLFYQLGTLVPSFSLPELAARADANSFYKIVDNPLFLPHKLIQYSFMKVLGEAGTFWMRSASALCALVIIVLFFDIIRSWYSRRIAFMGGALLLTSAWFLHFARLGTPQIMFACSVGLLWVGMKLKSASAPRIRTILASIAIVIACLYVPGLPWLIIPMLIWQRKLIRFELSKIPRWVASLTILGVLIGLTPLVYAFVKDPMLIRDWLMIPARVDIGYFWTNTWHQPIWFTLRGPNLPVYWLGRVPMLDSFSLVMGILGVFVLSRYHLLDRVRAVVAIILLALFLTIFNGWTALVIALPMIFIVVSAGVALFLQQWFTVFPRNPLARFVGVAIVSFVVALACTYNLRHYFIAWPRTPETRAVFSERP